MASASRIPLTHLFERGTSQCPLSNFDRCPQPTSETNWPDNFCCQKGSTCINLAGNTTLLCCPAGSGSCPSITLTACQMEFYNADLHPESMIKTTALNGAMPHCGSGTCCPFGYHCGNDNSGNPACLIDDNQNAVPFTTTPAKPSTTASSSTSSTTTTQTTTLTSSIQVIPTSSPTTSTPGQNNGASSGADTSPTGTAQATTSKGTPPAVIAGASVGAALLILAVAFVAFVFFKRRHKKQAEEAEALKLTRSTSSFGNIISNPIVAANTTMRSDFVRKSPGGGGGRSSFGSDRASTLVNEAAPVTPTPAARMREGVGTTARVPPIRNMAQARQSSIAYGVGAPDTSPYSSGNYHAEERRAAAPVLPYPETPRQGQQGREPSSISINVFADPRIATPQRNDGGGGGLAVPETPPDMRRTSRMTTFSDMLRSADLGGVARGEPYVPPGSQQGTPASRRR
ncbi:hypothetical protein CONLIGDRAFT_627130 [Coniochaeta ligniaria NRRL 30616]|uniref:Mid2 domain-containing protein n=1 Tax=Coniochaeta ligniaria NRRL 30616 TaxID=1408157 RepID=A0A1J7JNU4_9PEZI|nr:hypothetical protein CONLIGDRAFT_627130 [Coniochaeta ligniaria NRRL 30616]